MRLERKRVYVDREVRLDLFLKKTRGSNYFDDFAFL